MEGRDFTRAFHVELDSALFHVEQTVVLRRSNNPAEMRVTEEA
jgi:hypothetical protein